MGTQIYAYFGIAPQLVTWNALVDVANEKWGSHYPSLYEVLGRLMTEERSLLDPIIKLRESFKGSAPPYACWFLDSATKLHKKYQDFLTSEPEVKTVATLRRRLRTKNLFDNEILISGAHTLYCQLSQYKIKRFYDFGCGSGLVANYIASNFKVPVVGVELDPDRFKLANAVATSLRAEPGVRINIIAGSMWDLKIASGTRSHQTAKAALINIELSCSTLRDLVPTWLASLPPNFYLITYIRLGDIVVKSRKLTTLPPIKLATTWSPLGYNFNLYHLS